MHDNLVVDSNLLKIFGKLGQVPLACILVRIIVILWLVEVWASILYILIIFLVDWVVSQMNELLISCWLISRVFLRCKAGKAFFKQVDFKGIEASHERINPQVKFESINQERIWNVLRYYVIVLFLYFLLLAYNFYTASTWRSAGLHDVHVLKVLRLAIVAEFAVVIWKKIGSRAKVKFFKLALQTCIVLIHKILAANLEWLWKVVDLLVLRNILKLFGFCYACPKHIPLWAIWTYNPKASSF